MSTASCALRTLVDYKFVLREDGSNLSEIHRRVAQRWFDLICTNGGLFIKFGQGVASMNHVLPPEYQQLFTKLYDQAPFVPFAEIEQTVREDTGQSVDALFQSFDTEPIASASVAQVRACIASDASY